MPQLLHAGLQAALDRLAEQHPAGVRRAAKILVSGTRSVPLAEFAAYCVAAPRAASRPRGVCRCPGCSPSLACWPRLRWRRDRPRPSSRAARAGAALWTSDHAEQAKRVRRATRGSEEFLAGGGHHPRQWRQLGDVPQARRHSACLNRRLRGQGQYGAAIQASEQGARRRHAAGGAGLRLLAVKDITPLEGGLPVILDGTIIGAIGVSGALSSQDAQVARAGAAAVVK